MKIKIVNYWGFEGHLTLKFWWKFLFFARSPLVFIIRMSLTEIMVIFRKKAKKYCHEWRKKI